MTLFVHFIFFNTLAIRHVQKPVHLPPRSHYLEEQTGIHILLQMRVYIKNRWTITLALGSGKLELTQCQA